MLGALPLSPHQADIEKNNPKNYSGLGALLLSPHQADIEKNNPKNYSGVYLDIFVFLFLINVFVRTGKNFLLMCHSGRA